MHILSREEMYFFDNYTTEKLGIPSAQLMENAGKNCAEFIDKNLLKPKSKIAIFCGSGNNGGDGFVIARYLKKAGHQSEIFLVDKTNKMSPETFTNFQKCKNLQISEIDSNSRLLNLKPFDLIIDAIFGIGLKGDVRGFIGEIIKKINDAKIKTVSVDIASGVDAETGLAKIAINADVTLTLAAPKYGHFLESGQKKTGNLQIIDIGIPSNLFITFPPKTKLVTQKNVQYPKRHKFSHKGYYGKIGIIAGSVGFSGAAILASKAALRAGAGTITLFHPQGMETIFETQLVEIMTQSIPEQNEEIQLEKLFKKLEKMDTLLIGSGIGVNSKNTKLIEALLKFWQKPLILDADALNILAKNPNLFKLLKNTAIITPHLGEFSRLTKKSIAEIQNNTLNIMQSFAKKYKCSILLKSATTIFYGGKLFTFDISGNDGLSTGGSGDVLAGIIVAFVGQKLPLNEAAISASFLMGKTAEKLADYRKTPSIIPSDIIENIFKL